MSKHLLKCLQVGLKEDYYYYYESHPMSWFWDERDNIHLYLWCLVMSRKQVTEKIERVSWKFLGKSTRTQGHRAKFLVREHAEFNGNLNFNSENEKMHSKNVFQGCFKYCFQGPKTLPRWRACSWRHRPKLLHWNLQLHGHQRDRQMGSYHERVRFMLSSSCVHTCSEIKFSISTSIILAVFLSGWTWCFVQRAAQLWSTLAPHTSQARPPLCPRWWKPSEHSWMKVEYVLTHSHTTWFPALVHKIHGKSSHFNLCPSVQSELWHRQNVAQRHFPPGWSGVLTHPRGLHLMGE